jgi:hypothetical protein
MEGQSVKEQLCCPIHQISYPRLYQPIGTPVVLLSDFCLKLLPEIPDSQQTIKVHLYGA